MSDNLVPVQTTALVLTRQLPADRNPAAVYLAGMSRSSSKTMRAALDRIAGVITRDRLYDARYIDWGGLRIQHTKAIRARLIELYSPATVNKMLSALRGVLKAAWQLGEMTAEECALAKDFEPVPNHSLPAGRALDAREIEAMISTCQRDQSAAGVRDATLIVLLRAGGLRRAEISALMVADFKPLLKTLNIKGKRNKQRELPANTTVAAAIDDWLRIRGSQPGPLFCPINKSGAINTSHRLSAQSIYNIVIRRGVLAGVKDLSPHDFRRTFVGDLLEAGADISTVQQLAGHANVTTTQRYDRRGDKIKRQAVELLDIPYTDRGSI